MRRNDKAMVIIIAAALALTCSGCMKIAMDFAAAPDGSSSVKMLIGMDSSLAETGNAKMSGPLSDLPKNDPNWTSRQYKEGTWDMTEAIGHAGPGQVLMPGEGAPAPKLTSAARRLSTRYTLTLKMPQTPGGMSSAPEGADEQMQAMAKAMMANFQINFSLTAPGRVVETTGKIAGPGKAEWKLGIVDLNNKEQPEFRVVTELPNWANLGRLADQLAYTGRLNGAAPKLAAAVERGLLPNPLVSTSATDKLKPADYANLLEIIDKLDVSGRPAITDSVIGKLGLNGDGVSAKTIAEAHARVMKLDLNGLASQAISGALLEELQ